MVSEIPPPDDTQSEWTIVGERIRIARESSGISVRELARRIGVSPSHVSNVERGGSARNAFHFKSACTFRWTDT